MKRILLAVLLCLPITSIAAPIAWDFSWVGSNNYSMTGTFSYDSADAADGAIRDGEVQSLFFQGLLNGTPFASNSTAHTLVGFNFNFDATTKSFFLGGVQNTDTGQEWNLGGIGLRFICGSASCVLSYSTDASVFYDSRTDNPNTISVSRASVPEPGILSLLSLGLLGLSLSRRRKQL